MGVHPPPPIYTFEGCEISVRSWSWHVCMSQFYAQAPCGNQVDFNCLEDITAKRYKKLVLRPTRQEKITNMFSRHDVACDNMAQCLAEPGLAPKTRPQNVGMLKGKCYQGHPDFATYHSAQTCSTILQMVIHFTFFFVDDQKTCTLHFRYCYAIQILFAPF